MDVRVIMNVSYHPQFNPIEGCFSVVKKHFRRKRLNELVNGQFTSQQKAINNSFRQLTTSTIRNYIASSMR